MRDAKALGLTVPFSLLARVDAVGIGPVDGILAIPVFERGSSHYPVCRKPAITLSRKDWHSAANRAVL
jgi:hypothetical protein